MSWTLGISAGTKLLFSFGHVSRGEGRNNIQPHSFRIWQTSTQLVQSVPQKLAYLRTNVRHKNQMHQLVFLAGPLQSLLCHLRPCRWALQTGETSLSDGFWHPCISGPSQMFSLQLPFSRCFDRRRAKSPPATALQATPSGVKLSAFV